MRGGYSPLHIGQPHERPLSDRLTVKVPARSILPMIAFRDALCITHNPVNGTSSQGREGPARFAGCRITMPAPVGIIRNAASWFLSSTRRVDRPDDLGIQVLIPFLPIQTMRDRRRSCGDPRRGPSCVKLANEPNGQPGGFCWRTITQRFRPNEPGGMLCRFCGQTVIL
jgi:hypothetical protein